MTSQRQGTEQPRGALSLAGKLNRRRRLCELRIERAKGGADIHGKTAGAYGPILKRHYFNLHNKRCRHRLNSTQTTYKSIGCLCSPEALFYASLNWILKVRGKIILGFSYKISMCSDSFLLNHFCVSGMEFNQVSFFNRF